MGQDVQSSFIGQSEQFLRGLEGPWRIQLFRMYIGGSDSSRQTDIIIIKRDNKHEMQFYFF